MRTYTYYGTVQPVGAVHKENHDQGYSGEIRPWHIFNRDNNYYDSSKKMENYNIAISDQVMVFIAVYE
jgi:hypothetical protein